MTRQQLLIAGGGIGGLAASLATAQAGWDVRLFERAPEFTEVGAGIQLGPNVTRILHAWGLKDALAAVASFPERLSVRNALTGHQLGSLELGERMRTRYGAPYATIHRADIHGLLANAVSGHELIRVALGQPVIDHVDSGGVVTISIGAGTRVEGDALIGADGLWSGVREHLLADEPPRKTGYLAYRAMLKQSDLPEKLRSTNVTVWLGPKVHIVQYPVKGGEWLNVVAVVQGDSMEREGWDYDAQLLDLQRAMGPTFGAIQELVASASEASANKDPWRLWPLCDRPPIRSADQMARGLVALLGDAAHPMRPFLAQGAAMAIEDAAELARSLVMEAVDVPTRLKRYALARWQRCARIQARSIRNGYIFHSTGMVRLGRDLSIKLLGSKVLDVPWVYAP